jgi:predicted nucleic acid-binding protein
VDEPFGGRTFVADTSAWARRDDPRIASDWQAAIRGRQLLITPLVELEILYSALDNEDIASWRTRLAELREAPLTRSAISAARSAIAELGEKGPRYQRVPLTDLLIAAAAAEKSVGVLHCDRHFDRLADVLGFESRWLVRDRLPGAN